MQTLKWEIIHFFVQRHVTVINLQRHRTHGSGIQSAPDITPWIGKVPTARFVTLLCLRANKMVSQFTVPLIPCVMATVVQVQASRSSRDRRFEISDLDLRDPSVRCKRVCILSTAPNTA